MRLFEVLRRRMYVVGHPATYDPLLAKKRLVKAGREFEPGYPGGSVYFTVADAAKAGRRNHYGVYLLKYPYHPTNVYRNEDTGDYHLEHGMPIVRRIC
jgi:hypothetical protein